MNTTLDIGFARVEELGDAIIPRLNAVREASPIYWSETDESWIISGHAEVVEAFSGRLPLSAARFKLLHFLLPDEAERRRTIPNMLRYFPGMLINLDPPEHTRVRRLMLKPFSSKVTEAYRPHAREVIREVLDGVQGRSDVEFVEEVGRPVTARNIMRITGFEDEAFYLPKLKEWAYLANAGLSGLPSRDILRRTDAAFGEMAAAFQGEIDRRRTAPSDDFVSLLLDAGAGEGDKFSDDELIGELILILLAGHDTTLNTMALSINALSKDPAARDYMRDNPQKILNSVMELMRHIAMSTSQARIAARDFEWKGHEFKAGQIVTIMTAAANRDPRVFADPEHLDLTRDQSSNVAFGPGTHHCIGHLVAKMQLTEFFPEFLRRYGSFDILDKTIKFGGGLTFRGPQELHVRLHQRAS